MRFTEVLKWMLSLLQARLSNFPFVDAVDHDITISFPGFSSFYCHTRDLKQRPKNRHI